jgi:hypothetical protein
MLRGFVFGWNGFGCLITKTPVSLRVDPAVFYDELVRGWKFVDPFVNRKWRRHVVER